MKRINQILFSSITIILLLVGIILFQIITFKDRPDLNCQIPVPFCGTSNPKLTENQYKGKEIFNSNCAACHKLDAKSTGPALRNVDSLVFVKWIIDKNHKIDSIKIDKLGLNYHRTMFKDFLNEQNLALLIDYCSRTRY
jgi:mono/diheme cytochrome c family protein